MKKIKILLTSLLLSTTTVSVAEELSFDYQYDASVPRDMSMMSDGPLSLGSFSDQRDAFSGRQLRLDDGSLTLDVSASELLYTAFSQGFRAAGAEMAADDAGSAVFSGDILEFAIESTDAGYQVLLRVDARLSIGGRTAWNSVLFSRVETEDRELNTALSDALDRLLRELWWDDYFFMEFGIF